MAEVVELYFEDSAAKISSLEGMLQEAAPNYAQVRAQCVCGVGGWLGEGGGVGGWVGGGAAATDTVPWQHPTSPSAAVQSCIS